MECIEIVTFLNKMRKNLEEKGRVVGGQTQKKALYKEKMTKDVKK